MARYVLIIVLTWALVLAGLFVINGGNNRLDPDDDPIQVESP